MTRIFFPCRLTISTPNMSKFMLLSHTMSTRILNSTCEPESPIAARGVVLCALGILHKSNFCL